MVEATTSIWIGYSAWRKQPAAIRYTRQSMERRRISGTRLKLIGAFAILLALFGAALVVTLLTLSRIEAAEREVARLTRAELAAYAAAAHVREQYMHQAHSIIATDFSHLDHYHAAVAVTRRATARLRALAPSPTARERARRISRLAQQNDQQFRREVLPAIKEHDGKRLVKLHNETQLLVDRVVRLSAQLNASLERRSVAARARAKTLRRHARLVTVLCFVLAVALAIVVALLLTRFILHRLAVLRRGAAQVAGGDLSTKIEISGADEFAELARAFNGMTANLARQQRDLLQSHRLASIGEVAAGVAHEINNPLAVILGYAKISHHASQSESTEAMQIIETEARHCKRIVQNLLDLCRPRKLTRKAVELGALARDAAQRLKEAGHDAPSVIGPGEKQQALASGDEVALRQVVSNLLLNALEAAGPQGKVEASVSIDDGMATLRVTDDGPGIAGDVASRAFDPFFTTKAEGTGLGLAISQAIVHAHDGRIEIGPGSKGGTTALLRLPPSAPGEVEEDID